MVTCAPKVVSAFGVANRNPEKSAAQQSFLTVCREAHGETGAGAGREVRGRVAGAHSRRVVCSTRWSIHGFAFEQCLQARYEVLFYRVGAFDRARDHVTVVAAVGVGEREHGDVFVDIACDFERGGVAVLIEFEEA